MCFEEGWQNYGTILKLTGNKCEDGLTWPVVSTIVLFPDHLRLKKRYIYIYTSISQLKGSELALNISKKQELKLNPAKSHM